ncbi:MAG: hypothetical protein A2934_05720 [Candidatus Sungbacteria bacterium RIFCSPLOWO2_01_FULL_47_10]|uniref:Uncharacterized protein n=1 Tax=Candidatus Sungbacteria bacterium RIFCSPLOWO2_01_FULL_47_10 TaxID=1802276 RepID=A0A1G2L3E3_9BACT|nr:MAG: hypothetical protein A2934_05720 [Candidatus Sungbacteria bacterium RIFCSPLOWO2_01_FULL_47_10]
MSLAFCKVPHLLFASQRRGFDVFVELFPVARRLQSPACVVFIPQDCFRKMNGKGMIRLPSEALQFGSVQGIAFVMSRPVGDVGDEVFRFFERPEDC